MEKEKIKKCNVCGVYGEEEFDDKLWCPICLEEKTGICDRCENLFYKERLTAFDDKIWCNDCLNEETTICADCQERLETSRGASSTNADILASTFTRSSIKRQ